MLLPNKYIKNSQSIIVLSGIIASIISFNKYSIDELWDRFQIHNGELNVCPYKHSIKNVILALNFLYVIGKVDIDNDSRVYLIVS